jgi:hypothetical protein
MSGWGSYNKAEEMKEYICCSIIPPWGMSSEEPEKKALITLQPRTLCRNGTLFSGKWSSHGDVSLESLLNGQNVEAFDLMFPNETSYFPAPPPGEFLVPHCIPLSEFLSDIHLYNQEALDKAAESVKDITLADGRKATDRFRFVESPSRFRGSR